MNDQSLREWGRLTYHSAGTKKPDFPYKPPATSAVYTYNCTPPSRTTPAPPPRDRNGVTKPQKKDGAKKD